MNLAFQKLGSGKPLIILHGLFGMSDNWMNIGRKLSDQYTVYLVDQRNHGRSPHVNEFNYQVLGDDLCAFIDKHDLEQVTIIGHSMGGKVGLFFAEKCPDKIYKLIIADIALRSYRHPHFAGFIKALSNIDLANIHSRAEADTELAKIIPKISIRQFLLKNLARDDQRRFYWRINLPVIRKNLGNIMGAYQAEKPFTGPILFLRGGDSDYINDKDVVDILKTFPQAEIDIIPGASHWIHADTPVEFVNKTLEFLNN